MTALIGRTFLHPFFDYLLIGGGLSFVCTALVYQRQDPLIGWNPQGPPPAHPTEQQRTFRRVHRALYTEPGTFQQHPYLTWSSYHYAVQAYGLAIIYCVRSGYSLTAVERKVFRAICMLPFLLAFIGAPHAGLSWLAPSLHAVVPAMLRDVIISAVFLLPLAFFLYSYRRGPLYHAGRFYLLSLALGYGLFYCWPYAFVLTGFGLAESVLLVAAAINIHHFIVDAHIWRLAPGDGNRAITAT